MNFRGVIQVSRMTLLKFILATETTYALGRQFWAGLHIQKLCHTLAMIYWVSKIAQQGAGLLGV